MGLLILWGSWATFNKIENHSLCINEVFVRESLTVLHDFGGFDILSDFLSTSCA